MTGGEDATVTGGRCRGTTAVRTDRSAGRSRSQPTKSSTGIGAAIANPWTASQPERRERRECRGVLHALGHDPQPERVRERGDVPDDRGRPRIVEDVGDQGGVELELVRRQVPQGDERAAAAAVVVDGDRDAERAQLAPGRAARGRWCRRGCPRRPRGSGHAAGGRAARAPRRRRRAASGRRRWRRRGSPTPAAARGATTSARRCRARGRGRRPRAHPAARRARRPAAAPRGRARRGSGAPSARAPRRRRSGRPRATPAAAGGRTGRRPGARSAGPRGRAGRPPTRRRDPRGAGARGARSRAPSTVPGPWSCRPHRRPPGPSERGSAVRVTAGAGEAGASGDAVPRLGTACRTPRRTWDPGPRSQIRPPAAA